MVIYYGLNRWGVFLWWCWAVVGWHTGWASVEDLDKLSRVLILMVFLLNEPGKYNYFPVYIFLKWAVDQKGLVSWMSVTWLGWYFASAGGSACGAVPAEAAGRWCSLPYHAGSSINADKLQNRTIMKWILGAVGLKILHYEIICCWEGFECAVVLTLAVLVNRLLVTDSL